MVRIYKLRALSLSDAIKIKKLEIKAKSGILLWIKNTNTCQQHLIKMECINWFFSALSVYNLRKIQKPLVCNIQY